MLSRVTAEFETSELAELALKRARESSKDIYSTEIMYNKRSERAAKLSGGTHFTVACQWLRLLIIMLPQSWSLRLTKAPSLNR